MFDEKVSVIIPAYNCEKYLRECLDSILNQSYRNIEVIIVDDCSIDGTGAICEEYRHSDKRIVYYRNSINSGAAASRNRGLSVAAGEYIAFIDSDDTIDADFLEVLIDGMKENDADISMYNFAVNGLSENIVDDVIIEKEQIFDEYVNGKITNRIANKVYRKEIVNGLEFPAGRDFREDAVFTPMLLERADRIVGLSCAKYNYRFVKGSLSHQKISEKKAWERAQNEWECISIVMRNISNVTNPSLRVMTEKIIYNTFLNNDKTLANENLNRMKMIVDEYRSSFESIGGIVKEIAVKVGDRDMDDSKYLNTILLSRNVPVKKKVAILVRRFFLL